MKNTFHQWSCGPACVRGFYIFLSLSYIFFFNIHDRFLLILWTKDHFWNFYLLFSFFIFFSPFHFSLLSLPSSFFFHFLFFMFNSYFLFFTFHSSLLIFFIIHFLLSCFIISYSSFFFALQTFRFLLCSKNCTIKKKSSLFWLEIISSWQVIIEFRWYMNVLEF